MTTDDLKYVRGEGNAVINTDIKNYEHRVAKLKKEKSDAEKIEMLENQVKSLIKMVEELKGNGKTGI